MVEVAKADANIIIVIIAEIANPIIKRRLIIFSTINSENEKSKRDEKNPFGSMRDAPI